MRALATAVLILVASAPFASVFGQDALTDRYRAIRAPSEIQANRTARQRVQSELNALGRQDTRSRIELRSTERLQYQDPVSPQLPVRERALRGELNRIDADRRATAAELDRLSRQAEALAPAERLSVGPADPDAPIPIAVTPRFDPEAAETAVEAARVYVEQLLQASRARAAE